MKDLNENLSGVVKILSDREFHDGTDIGNQLGITRAAVWKVIKKLEAYHIPINSVKGRGYSLQDDLLLLDKRIIKKNLEQKRIPIDILETVDSTNDYLKSTSSDGPIRVCLAEHQTAGRGRFNRTWHSPFGQNLYFSLRYRFEKDLCELQGLSIAIGTLLIEAIESSFNMSDKLMLKWPNDIYCNGAKLAGSLVEIQAESNGYCSMVLGIGVNVNMLEMPKSWTSVRKINQTYNDRNILCANLANLLLDKLNNYDAEQLPHYRKLWQARDFLLNKSIKLKAHTNTIQGNVLGLDKQGRLKLKLKNGHICSFSSGDTSLS